jgi:hypothetical protein
MHLKNLLRIRSNSFGSNLYLESRDQPGPLLFQECGKQADCSWGRGVQSALCPGLQHLLKCAVCQEGP